MQRRLHYNKDFSNFPAVSAARKSMPSPSPELWLSLPPASSGLRTIWLWIETRWSSTNVFWFIVLLDTHPPHVLRQTPKTGLFRFVHQSLVQRLASMRCEKPGGLAKHWDACYVPHKQCAPFTSKSNTAQWKRIWQSDSNICLFFLLCFLSFCFLRL